MTKSDGNRFKDRWKAAARFGVPARFSLSVLTMEDDTLMDKNGTAGLLGFLGLSGLLEPFLQKTRSCGPHSSMYDGIITPSRAERRHSSSERGTGPVWARKHEIPNRWSVGGAGKRWE